MMFTIKEEVNRWMFKDFSGNADQVVAKLSAMVLDAKQGGYITLEFDTEDRYLILFGERLETFEEEDLRKQQEDLEKRQKAEQQEQDALWDNITKALEGLEET